MSIRSIDECFYHIQNGANIKQGEIEGGYPITRIETTSNDMFNRDRMGYAGITDLTKYDSYVLEDGDLLMSHINSIQYLGRTVLYEKIGDEIIIHGMNLLRLKANRDIVIPAYARYSFYSHSFRSQLANITKKSVNQASFAVKDLKRIKLDIPNLSEQNYIVSTLDKLQSIITHRKQQLEKLDELVKARFVEMFGEPVLNTMDWECKSVIDECDCQVPGRDKPKSFTGDIPWITIEDLCVNGITYNSKSGLGLTQNEIDEVGRKTIPKNSVIMSCVGNLGICSIAGCDMIINQQLHSFQCGKRVNNIFLMNCLGFQKEYMNKWASNTTVLYMNKSICNSIPIIVPPLELQNQFAAFVSQVDKSKAVVQKSLDEAQLLFDSLMQEYFG